MKTFVVCLMLIFMTSCATRPVVSECGWVTQIIVSPGDVITRATAEQIVQHNRKVAENCP